MKKIIFTLLLATSLIVTGQEKEDKGTFTLSGTVDVYGTTNFTKNSGTPGILIASPENANAFGLGFANTVFAYEKGKAGVVADVAFGPRADDANMAGAINQLYAYYNVSDKLTLTADDFENSKLHDAKKGVYVIIGTFSYRELAENFAKKTKASGYREADFIYSVNDNYNYVYMFKSNSKKDAINKIEEAREKGSQEAWILILTD